MKAVHKIAAGLAVAGLAVSAALAARPIPEKTSRIVDGGSAVTATAAAGFNYATGFENTGLPGGYNTLGYICHCNGFFPAGCGSTVDPCWGHTTGAGFSLITPTISNAHPATGAQHLRLTPDGSTRTNIPNFGLGVDARYPRTAFLSARPVAPNTVSIDMSISASFGQDFRVQPQSNSQGFLATSALFFYAGSIYILDDLCGATGLGFAPTGVFWDTTGGYQNYTVAMNPCLPNYVKYYYGGVQIYQGCPYAGTNLEQFLVFGDNYPGSLFDGDNLVMESQDECRAECGNGFVEPPNEQCEVGPGQDTNCPGRCIPVGQPGACTCTPICTQAEPCPVVNGANGPYKTSSGWYVYSGGSPFVSFDNCGSGFDTSINVTTLADPATSLSYNDDCGVGNFSAGSDTSAACYDGEAPNATFESCTCVANPGVPLLLEIDVFGSPPAAGSSTIVNVRKKSVCEGASVGACCDTNGHDGDPGGVCTDNVTQAACNGPFDVWTNQGKCASTHCVCIPDCNGRNCGDDGCGGSCGVCGDNLACNGVDTCPPNGVCQTGPVPNCNDNIACTADACVEPNGTCTHTPNNALCSDNNVCDGLEICDVTSGCIENPGSAPQCDDGLFCTGVESCDPILGCQDNADPCDPDREVCDEEKNQCEPSKIPTVSEWGLVVLTLMFMIGAKVYFGRRQELA